MRHKLNLLKDCLLFFINVFLWQMIHEGELITSGPEGKISLEHIYSHQLTS